MAALCPRSREQPSAGAGLVSGMEWPTSDGSDYLMVNGEPGWVVAEGGAGYGQPGKMALITGQA